MSISHSFRQKHILRLLQDFEGQKLPIDVFVNHYLRSHRSIGSKDRKMVVESVYALIRWRSLLDYLCQVPTWAKRLEWLERIDPMSYKEDAQIPLHVRSSFPQVLFDYLCASYGQEKAFELCLTSNTPAPVTVRANLLKTTREALMARWEGLPLQKCRFSEVGIVVKQRMQLTQLPEFKEGLFEYQDEASQLVAAKVQARAGQSVLDYCAGSGGKALAIAARMENRGQIFLHDVRKRAGMEAKVRLRRAGVQNSQILGAEDPRLSTLKGKMDWVLVDAPCTGSGTWRRNPDMKWRFEIAMVEELVAKQRQIFENGLNYLAPKGRIVYVTCSLFAKENEEQVSYLMERHGLQMVEEPFQSLPKIGQMDGFFSATLARR